jgi:radical SAM superfamily enzyme YgiQ (UPF0313 family)
MKGTSVSAEMYAEWLTSDDLPYLDAISDCDVGLQTTTPEALAAMGRPWAKERFEHGFHLLRGAGKVVSCYLLIGLPGDNLTGFRSSLDYATGLQPTKLFCNPLLVLRGTPLRNEAARYGLRYRSDPPYEALGCTTFPPEQLVRAQALGRLAMCAYSGASGPPWQGAAR